MGISKRTTCNGRRSRAKRQPFTKQLKLEAVWLWKCLAGPLRLGKWGPAPVLVRYSTNKSNYQMMRPALMLAGRAISIFAGRGVFLLFMISMKVALSIDRFRRSLNRFSSPMVEDTLPL